MRASLCPSTGLIDVRVGGVWEVLVKIWESGRKMAPCGPDLPRRALERRIRYQNYREREGFDEVKPRTSQEFRGAFQTRVSCLHSSNGSSELHESGGSM